DTFPHFHNLSSPHGNSRSLQRKSPRLQERRRFRLDTPPRRGEATGRTGSKHGNYREITVSFKGKNYVRLPGLRKKRIVPKETVFISRRRRYSEIRTRQKNRHISTYLIHSFTLRHYPQDENAYSHSRLFRSIGGLSPLPP